MSARLLSFAMIGALVLSGCSAAADPEPTSVPDFGPIRQAREAFAAPASELGTAVRAAVVAAQVAWFEPAASAHDGRPAVEARTFTIDAYEDRLDAVAVWAGAIVDVPDSSDFAGQLSAAQAAWRSAESQAASLVQSGRREIELLRELLDAESLLAVLASLWDQPGSRRQQSARLADAVPQARDAVQIVAKLEAEPACSEAVARRLVAAETILARTDELARFARNGQGRAYDEARASYDVEPWHDGLPTADTLDGECWNDASGVAEAARDVDDALQRLVDALNPTSDLPGSTTTGG